jgi:hypothetical protein
VVTTDLGGDDHGRAIAIQSDGKIVVAGGISAVDFALACNEGQEKPTAVELASFTTAPGAGSVRLAWETGTKVDNARFNLYRATSPVC